MATSTFSSLPDEIHVSIAEHLDTHDLFNFCLTLKRVNERCVHVLYRHVDLWLHRHDGDGAPTDYHRMLDARKRQQQFVHTLLRHPEYGKHVRYFGGKLCVPSLDNYLSFGEHNISDEEFWGAMQSLTRIQCVDVGSRNCFASRVTVPTNQFPNHLFQSATSVRLVGHMQYGLAKAILNAINPGTLQHLCLDVVQDHKIGHFHRDYTDAVGMRGEDGQMIALGATAGLLTTLTGRCTALRTLILRRLGQFDDGYGWHTAAEDASCIEWASFIHSVQRTVEHFAFHQTMGEGSDSEFGDTGRPLRIMDERFARLVLPAIVSGNWPRLRMMEVGGVRSLNDEDGIAGLTTELHAALGADVEISVMVEEGRVGK